MKVILRTDVSALGPREDRAPRSDGAAPVSAEVEAVAPVAKEGGEA